jgi:ATP-dependent DNA helicase PIF1
MPFALTRRAHAKTTSKPASLVMNDGFRQAFDCLEKTNEHLLLTGKAGTGKSTFLDWFRLNTDKQVAVVAPTGVAALNVRGQTIHSLFQLKPCFQHPASTLKLYGENAALLRHIDTLIVDEISMVRADVFDAMAQLLTRYGKKRSQPFGGTQLCLMGDMRQLPPVISGQESDLFYQFYTGATVLHAKAWQQAPFQTIEFTDIYRQTDPAFVAALNAVREGEVSADVLHYLNARHQPEQTPDDVVVLTARVNTAEALNTRMLQALTAKPVTYTATRKGTFSRDKTDKLPSPEHLTLKVGAQVMFTKNDAGNRRWVNGTLGKVMDLQADSITVRTENEVVEVERESWQSVRFGVAPDGSMVEDETGRYTQFPLMLAWAITIHKSQGKTLDKVVLDLEGGAFAPGQLYVALSRARRYEGLWLKRKITLRDLVSYR